MRHKRTAAAGAVFLVATFSTVCFLLRLQQQSTALLAAREVPDVVKRYARVQEALKQAPPNALAFETTAQSNFPQVNPEITELVDSLKQAQSVFTRIENEFLSDEEWPSLREDLFSRPVSTWSASDWERLSTFLDAHRELLAEIRAMAATGGPLYPLDLSQGWAMELPHLAHTRSMALLLQAEALVRGHGGDFEGAAADIRAGLQLAARLQGEPLLISQLVAVAIDNSMMEGVTGAWPEGEIPAALVAEISRQFHTYSMSESIAQSMNTETGISLDVFANIMDHGWMRGREFDWVQGWMPLGSWTGPVYTSPLARPWQHLDMQAYAHIMSEFAPTLALPYYEAQATIEQLQREINELPATRVIARNMLPSLINIHSAIAQAEAQQQIFLLGTAVESYANEHGSYPTRLEDVQGRANGASTIDPFTGDPYHYNSNGNGFELYSVGRDLADDGGRNDLRDGDIVWRGETSQKAAGVKVAGLK